MADARRRRNEYWAGLAAMLLALVIVVAEVWPVPSEGVGGDSVVASLLDDRALIGILRLAIVVAALYFVASVPALIVGGRWARGAGTTGILADEPAGDPPMVAEARRDAARLLLAYERVKHERDELLSLMDARTRPD